ncbi:unnamed protein product [Psylliodes chrysocephalus]|uniref:Uncharacterized protein n=1 Tax=Psylliodes chrysocephalus TaxID=3402493 RepID=A0A9P0CQ85_9CUCU|nr:unnamed protein product [Psylliodes chrysocephala]
MTYLLGLIEDCDSNLKNENLFRIVHEYLHLNYAKFKVLNGKKVILLFLSVSATLADEKKTTKRGVYGESLGFGVGSLDLGHGGIYSSEGAGLIHGGAGLVNGGFGLNNGGFGSSISYAPGIGYDSGAINLGQSISNHVTVTKKIGIPVPQPYPVTVERKIPYPVYQAVPVPVDRPYAVHVPKPYPVAVEKRIPVPVIKHVPYAVKVPVKVPYAVPYKVAVPQPYPVHITKHVPVPVHTPVYIKKAVPVVVSSGWHKAVTVFAAETKKPEKRYVAERNVLSLSTGYQLGTHQHGSPHSISYGAPLSFGSSGSPHHFSYGAPLPLGSSISAYSSPYAFGPSPLALKSCLL